MPSSRAVNGHPRPTGVGASDPSDPTRAAPELLPDEPQFRSLVGQLLDHEVIALDPDGRVQSWNAGAERLKGYRAEEVVGRPFTMFFTVADQRTGLPADLLRRARADGHVQHAGWRVRKDGTRFWADVVLTALHDDDGRLTGFAKVTRDLTEQHELESRLRASEERFRSLVEQVVDYAIIGLDEQGRITTWNAGARALKGYEAEEAIGRPFTIFYSADDQQDGLPHRLLAEARAQGRVEHLGWRIRKDGTQFFADVVITAVRGEEGRVVGFTKVTRDLTEQHQLQSSLNQSEERYRTLIDQVLDYAILALDVDGTIASWNAGAQRVKGYSSEEAIGRSFAIFYRPEDQREGAPQRALAEATRAGRVHSAGWRVRKDGSQFWADVVLTAVRDRDGNLRGFSKVTRDLTLEHELHQEIRESEERFRLLVDQTVDYAIVALDARGAVESWNAGAEALQGWSSNEVLDRSFAMFYTSEDQLACVPQRLLEQARAQGRVTDVGWRARRDGSRFWADEVITAVHGSSGQLRGFSRVTRDLTQQHDLNEALRESEERYRSLVDQVVDYAIVGLDSDGAIEAWNAGAAQLHGYDEGLVLGRWFGMLFDFDDQERGVPAQLLESASREGRVRRVGWQLTHDGSTVWADTVVTALVGDDDNELRGYSVLTRDLTARRRDDALDAAACDARSGLDELRQCSAQLRSASDADGGDPGLTDRLDAVAARLERALGRVLEVAQADAAREEPAATRNRRQTDPPVQ